eukprot:CAMPEP_0180229242 /NCGR_PEP_ID=MMETSP0987-20121128/25355_1 /TAXON_ID=697907 /ORGANISM="non described non described, Strain CCMP2293" /LENGTH=65 /DNA_ID=CAMNT_0022193815 /DNA_START=53 /DNA_END=247 /DNA_ORIENTATION=+
MALCKSVVALMLMLPASAFHAPPPSAFLGGQQTVSSAGTPHTPRGPLSMTAQPHACMHQDRRAHL